MLQEEKPPAPARCERGRHQWLRGLAAGHGVLAYSKKIFAGVAKKPESTQAN
ncbi:hypothetical protein ACFQOZ_11330 [Comamonas endophytica]|uniref:hypothetical protein n=1 Tax=Comamonas endophytica TaxID=2949090 RepID=UPI003610E059